MQSTAAPGTLPAMIGRARHNPEQRGINTYPEPTPTSPERVSFRRRQRPARACGIIPPKEDIPVLGRRRRRGPGNADGVMQSEVVTTRHQELLMGNDIEKNFDVGPIGLVKP